MLVQLHRPLVVGERVRLLSVDKLRRAKVVPPIRILAVQLHRPLEVHPRQLDVAHLQLSQAQLVGQRRRISAARDRIPVKIHGIFRKAPRPQNVGLHLQRLGRRRGRVRQMRLNLRPLLRLVHTLPHRAGHGPILRYKLVLRLDLRRPSRSRKKAQRNHRAHAHKLHPGSKRKSRSGQAHNTPPSAEYFLPCNPACQQKHWLQLPLPATGAVLQQAFPRIQRLLPPNFSIRPASIPGVAQDHPLAR